MQFANAITYKRSAYRQSEVNRSHENKSACPNWVKTWIKILFTNEQFLFTAERLKYMYKCKNNTMAIREATKTTTWHIHNWTKQKHYIQQSQDSRVIGRYVAEHRVIISDEAVDTNVYTVRCKWWKFCSRSWFSVF